MSWLARGAVNRSTTMPRIVPSAVPDPGHAARRSVFVKAVFASDLPPTLRLVLYVVAWSAGPDGHGSYLSTTAVAARTGLGERWVRKHLATARKLGWLAAESRPGRTNDWLLRVPAGARAVPVNAASPRQRMGATPGAADPPVPLASTPPPPGLGAPPPRSPRPPVGRNEEVPRRARVAWCGSCDERTRIQEVDLGTGASRRCPHCHPLIVTPRDVARRSVSRTG